MILFFFSHSFIQTFEPCFCFVWSWLLPGLQGAGPGGGLPRL